MFEGEQQRSSSSEPEDRERLLTDDIVFFDEKIRSKRTLSWFAIAALVVSTACLAGSAGAWIGSKQWKREPNEVACTERLNQYCKPSYSSTACGY